MLILVIFLGYIMIWIMMPTNQFWLHWLPDIHAKTDSTYLGQQGANILIYTFPILLIATLGCLYLHLDKYGDDSDNRRREDQYLNSWKQPALVRSPLGIISWTELLFVLMFIALLVWSFYAYVHGMFKNITTQSASKMGEVVWEVRLDSVALLLGLVGNICLSFLFFPVTRGSPILCLVGLTSESSIKYHIWLGHTALTLFLAHALCYVVFWANTHQISEMLKWNRVGISNMAGEVALLSGLAMWIASSSPVRRKLFELFFYTHHLYIVFIVFFVLHVGFSYSCIMLPGFYLFLIDRFLRFLQSQRKICVTSARVLPCQAMELNFSKDPRLNYSPSSIVFINVKSISKLQWHPFTVTSNNRLDPNQLSIVIKSEGSWSQKLYAKLSSLTPMDRLEVAVEGPHMPPSTSFLRHDMLVLVSGGSGITPFISIIRELVFLSNSHEETPKVLLVAAFKKSPELTMLNLLLPFSGTPHDVSRLQLQIQAYITRDTNPSKESQKQPMNIWFESSVSDAPVSGVSGTSSWLWLGAIISASLVAFLLLIGLANRFYYIHPIDGARSVANLVFLCMSVVIVATLIFVWNKKQNATDGRQIQSANTPTQMATPTAASGLERELESAPEEYFKQVTTVHYGERPNFKKIISECEGSDIGVFVSGPEKMRKDVAAICSSGSAKGLLYKSYSFDW
ncbi:hypothetical protein C2S52_008924 [Perilla frutescens var. hirtella]|nr:hypothetical protein C2S52_008924 [Perilla frutescens var. hirtella]